MLKEWVRGYIPSLMMASPTHFEIMTAIMIGTMYVSPPVNSNMMTTRDTGRERKRGSYNLEKYSVMKPLCTATVK